MNNTDQKKLLSEPVLKMLKDKNFAFLGTKMKDGYPQVTPTWIDVENDDFVLINTAKGRVKHRNVLRDPRVSVSMIDRNDPYKTITIKGKVIQHITQGADEHIDKLSKKYMNLDSYPFRSSSEERVILKIKPEKVFIL